MRLGREALERDDQHDEAADKAEGGLVPRQPIGHRLDAEGGDGAEQAVGECRTQACRKPHDDAAFQGAADAEQSDRPDRCGNDYAEQDSTHQNRHIFHAQLPRATLMPQNAAEYAFPVLQPEWRIEWCGTNPPSGREGLPECSTCGFCPRWLSDAACLPCGVRLIRKPQQGSGLPVPLPFIRLYCGASGPGCFEGYSCASFLLAEQRFEAPEAASAQRRSRWSAGTGDGRRGQCPRHGAGAGQRYWWERQ